jgi:hypothetical protein
LWQSEGNLKKRELPVSFYELRVNARFRGHEARPVPPSPMDLLNLCNKADRSPIQKGPIRRVIEDWQIQKDQHVLLINRADSNTTDVALVDFTNGHRRTAGKKVHDGIEYSCHILIDPPRKQRTLPMLLATGGSGMSRDQIEKLLNVMIRRAAQAPENEEFFTRPHPDAEAGKKVKMICTIELLAHQSLMIKDVLSRGLLQEVQLIAHESSKLDQHFLQKAHSITIGIAAEGTPLSIAALRNAFQATKINADKLVLKFNDPSSGKSTAKTIAFNELEEAMTKREVLEFTEDLLPCYTSICKTIEDKLREQL